MNNFESNIINIYGQRGQDWLQNLPNLVNDIALKYGLHNLEPVPNLSYNYVLSGYRRDIPIILKLSPNNETLEREALALQSFAGHGGVNIIDRVGGLLLIKRIIPGISLKNYFPARDDEAINIACEVIKKLWSAKIPSQHNFPYIKEWLGVLEKNLDIPSNYLQKAKQLRDKLLLSSSMDILLHGDLHHDNILLNRDQEIDDWVVIDPKGVIGDIAYEVVAFIINPIPELLEHVGAHQIIQKRILEFSIKLGFPHDRINNWCFVQAVHAWAWALEDRCDTKHFEGMTEILAKMQP